jgi:hypothetical protein
LKSTSYQIIGGVSPSLKIYIGDISLNYNYSPAFEYAELRADGFHYFSIREVINFIMIK